MSDRLRPSRSARHAPCKLKLQLSLFHQNLDLLNSQDRNYDREVPRSPTSPRFIRAESYLQSNR